MAVVESETPIRPLVERLLGTDADCAGPGRGHGGVAREQTGRSIT